MSFVCELEARTLGREPRAFYPVCNMTLTDSCKREHYKDVIERHLPHVLKEKRLEVGECDKIFASQWLSEDLVIIGTKCNKVSKVTYFFFVPTPLLLLVLNIF